VAHADTPTIGLYAPSEPFPSTAARLEAAARLGQLGGSGKVFARSADFAAALKKGEVAVALVDASYLATSGAGGTVIAQAVRGNESAHAWQLVAKSGVKLASLKGKRVIVPAVSGREADFVYNVLLGGELPRDYFAKLESAPDTASALAAVGVGQVTAAIVPTGAELPAGTLAVIELAAVPGPLLVAYGKAARRPELVKAALAFKGDGLVAGFRAADADIVRQLARRFVHAVKRGPLAVPAARLLVGDLVDGRELAIERTPATAFVAGPERH
jgi:hypothetical protein